MASYFSAFDRQLRWVLIGLAACGLSASLASAQAATTSLAAPPSLVTLPLAFEPNRGQADAAAQFLARGPHYAVLLSPRGAELRLRQSTGDRLDLEMILVGANAAAHGRGTDQLPGRVNYYSTGPGRTHEDLPTYARVAYTAVYPGIDLVYHGNQGQMEFDFVVAPGADPGHVRLAFRGANDMRTDDAGRLVFEVGNDHLSFHRPVAYQEKNGARQPVTVAFARLPGGQVGFELGAYDPARPLVIDPIILYKTYLGGAGTDHGTAIAVDADGNRYFAGTTDESDISKSPPDVFTPHGTGSTHTALSGKGVDAVILKVDPAGTTMLYSAFFGGQGTDTPNAMTLDASNNVYIVGDTTSAALPGEQALDHQIGNQDAFVLALDSNLKLRWARHLGGSGQESGLTVAFHQNPAPDNDRLLYVGGTTTSTIAPFICAPHDHPTSDPLDVGDGYIVRLLADTGAQDGQGVCVGGSRQDQLTSLAVDAAGDVYFAGATRSGDLPTTSTLYGSPFQQGFAGGAYDGFVGKLANDGTTMQYLTYLGGSNDDYIYGLAIDGSGNAYVTGQTSSNSAPAGQFQPTPFPTRNAVQRSHGGGTYDAFVTKLGPQGKNLIYSTYLGGSGDDQGVAIGVNSQNQAYIAGTTRSANFPLANSWQRLLMGPSDGFVAEYSDDGTQLKLSTYFGGSGDDRVNNMIVAKSGGLDRAYLVGTTTSFDMPSVCVDIQVACTDTSLQPYYGIGEDAFMADVSAGEAATLSAPNGIAITGANIDPVVIYIADTNNSVIRQIAANGVTTTLAGSAGITGNADGTGAQARFNHPAALAMDRNGNLYVADTGNSTIRKVTPAGVVTTIAGIAGQTGSADNAIGTQATFNQPAGVATDDVDNLYVADTGNSLIRKINTQADDKPVTTVAGIAGQTGSLDGISGTLATFDHPTGLLVQAGISVYVADTGNATIRRLGISNGRIGQVVTLAGSAGQTGSTDGSGAAARFDHPSDIALSSSGNLLVTDAGNSTIRQVSVNGVVTTLAGAAGITGNTDNATATQARFNHPGGIDVDGFGNVFIADTGNNSIREIVAADSSVSTLSGTGTAGHADGFGTSQAQRPQISISIDQQPGPIEVANTYTYNIVVRNNGSSTATNVMVTVRMQNAILRDVGGNDATGAFIHCPVVGAVTSACTAGNIAPGGNQLVTVLALPNALGKATVTVSFLRANETADALQPTGVSTSTLIVDSSGGYGGSVSWDFYLLILLGWSIRRFGPDRRGHEARIHQ